MSAIEVHENGSIEKGILEYFAMIFNNEMEKTNSKYHMAVKDIYFDYGLNWLYTTLVVDDGTSSWQALNPRDYENIVTCDSFATVWSWAIDYVEAILNGKLSVHLTF